MNFSFLLVGLTLGLMSSLHCVGMCGPIALALPVHQFSKLKKFAAILLYQLGRITTYSFMGLVVGFIGQGIHLAGWQGTISIVLGVLIIVFTILYYVFNKSVQTNILSKPLSKLQTVMGKLLRAKRALAYYPLGIANGFLPCGMVYTVIAIAITVQDILTGVLFMAAFGIGTIPAMMLLTYLGNVIGLRWRNLFKKLFPYILILMGLLLILRGLELGIPYLSPPPHSLQMKGAGCCH